MAKKTFDIKSTLAVPTRSFSVEDIEAATRQIHQQNEKKVAENQVVVKEKKEKAIKSVVDEVPVRRPKAVQKGKESAIPVSKKTGKPAATPSPILPKKRGPEAPIVRKVRLSVDVLPETHKRLKIRAIEMDSDIMRYVEMLIERDLAK